MKRFHYIVPLISMVFLSLFSCSSTDIMEADASIDDNLVTLTVSTPATFGFGSATRADNTRQLRLIANLYSTESKEVIKRIETLPTEVASEESDVTQTSLSFEIDKPGDYYITIFADYIETGSTKDERGRYPDSYYNTTDPARITMIADQQSFFNNDYRDCFSGKISFTKDAHSLDKTIRLQRAVSKVVIAAPEDEVETLVSSLTITACSYLDGYNFALDNTTTTAGSISEAAKAISLALNDMNINSPGRELFFFYTFAGSISDTSRPYLGEVSFTLTSKSGIPLKAAERTIGGNLIQPAINHLVSVNGAKGWISAEAGGNDIIVNIKPADNWVSAE